MNVILPDGTTTAELKANINVKTSAPATSEGPGELIYRSDESKVYVNTGTAGSPVWTDISGSSGTSVHNDLTSRDASDCHPQSAITGLVTALAGKLPLAGGTLTGQLNFNSVNDYVTQYVNGENTGLEMNGNYYGVILKAGGVQKLQVATSGLYAADDINMQTNMITNLGTASADGDAVSKEYAEDYFLKRIGGSTYAMAGDLYTGGNGVVFESSGTPDNWITPTTPVADTILQIMGEDEVDICVGGSAGSPALTATTSAVTVVKRLYIGNSDTYLERESTSPYRLKIVCNGFVFDTA